MENPPFEDVFPIESGDFPLLCLFTGGYNPINDWFFWAQLSSESPRVEAEEMREMSAGSRHSSTANLGL